jgi:predicted DNA-binding transcriptional regulator AlpA
MTNFSDDELRVNTETADLQRFIRLNDLHLHGYLPWKRSRLSELIKSGVLPQPKTFGPRLRGYTLAQIRDIQAKHMVGT